MQKTAEKINRRLEQRRRSKAEFRFQVLIVAIQLVTAVRRIGILIIVLLLTTAAAATTTTTTPTPTITTTIITTTRITRTSNT